MSTLGPNHASVGTSVATPADLSNLVTNSLSRGTWGYAASTDAYYSFQPTSTVPIGPAALPSYDSQGGTLPGRWIFVTAASGGGGGASVPFSHTFYCDPLTTVPIGLQDGSDERPFSTINAAIAQALAVGGVGVAIILTAGVYNESVIIPPGTTALDRIDIVGMGNPSTRIVAPPGLPAFGWSPTVAVSPATRWRISGVTLTTSGGAYALDLDGSLVTVGVFFGDVSIPVTPNSEGLVIQDCRVEGARLVRTGIVNLLDSDVASRPDLTTDFFLADNTVLTLAHSASFAGQNGSPAANIRVRHTDPLALRFLSLGLFGTCKCIDGCDIVLEGAPGFYQGEGGFFDSNFDATGLTAASDSALIYLEGSAGFLGGGGFFAISLPDSDNFSEPYIDCSGAHIKMPVTIQKVAGVLLTSMFFRGTIFESTIQFPNTIPGNAQANLVGASFQQGQILLTSTFVLRDTVTYGAFGPVGAGPTSIPISPPFPPGTFYNVLAESAGLGPFSCSSPLGSRTNVAFDLMTNAAVPDIVDITLALVS